MELQGETKQKHSYRIQPTAFELDTPVTKDRIQNDVSKKQKLDFIKLYEHPERCSTQRIGSILFQSCKVRTSESASSAFRYPYHPIPRSRTCASRGLERQRQLKERTDRQFCFRRLRVRIFQRKRARKSNRTLIITLLIN